MLKRNDENLLNPDEFPLDQANWPPKDILYELINTTSESISVLEAVKDPVSQEIYDFRIAFLNAAASRMAAPAKKVELGGLLTELYPNSLKNGVIERFADVVSTGNNLQFVHTFSPFGQEISIFLHVQKFRDTSLIVTAVDVTPQIAAENRLRRSEEQMKKAQALSHVGSYEVEFPANHLSCSDEMYRIFGYEPGELQLTREILLSHIHPEDMPQLIEIHREIIARGEQCTFNFRIRKRDGKIAYIRGESQIQKKEDGNPIGMRGFLQDVTITYNFGEELTRSQSFLLETQEIARTGSYEWHIHKTDHIWSPEMYRIYGVPENEKITRELLLSRIHPEDLDSLTKATQDALAGLRPLNTEYRVVLPDGRISYIWSKAKVLYDKQGQPERVLGSAADITELKETVSRLQDRESFARNIADATPDLIYIIRLFDLSCAYVNHAADEILGYCPEELQRLGQSLLPTIIHKDDQSNFLHRIQKVSDLPDNEIRSFQFRINHPVHGERWLNSRMVVYKRNKDGSARELLGIADDITERKTMENELLTSRNFLLHSQQIAKVGSFKWNISEDVLQSTPQMNRILGLQARSVLTRDIFRNCAHPEDRERIQEAIYRSIETASSFREECRILRPDGGIRYILTRAEPVLDENGRTESFTGTVLDITDIRTKEHELTEKNEELQRSNRDLEQFAYVASHDLKEPLRMVASYANLLETRFGDKLGEDGKEFIDFVLDGAMRMNVLVNDLLDFSRIGRRDTSFSCVDLNEVIEIVRENLKPAIHQSQALLDVGNLPTILAVESNMIQLLQNLVENAIKFHSDKQPLIRISAEHSGDHWEICVADNGIGIENEYLDKIFVIFQRLHGRDKYPGTGIGLAICKKIVEFHGGQIWVESRPDKGSAFYFSLPEKGEMCS